MKLTRAYVRKLYNRFQATLVPSERLADLLSEWGVHNVRPVRLGVNTEVFNPAPDDAPATRQSLGLEPTKNCCSTSGVWLKKKILKRCSEHLSFCAGDARNKFHLLIIGDGPQRQRVQKLQRSSYRGNISVDSVLRLILLISPATIVQRIYSFTRASRKHLALLRWRARRAARRWSEFAAVTWIGLFVTTRDRGHAKTLRKRWPARLRVQAQKNWLPLA